MQDLSTSSIVQQTELSSSDGLASSQPLCGQPGEQASALPGSSKASSFLRVPKDFEAPSSPPGPASSPCPDQHRTAGRKARTPATLDDFADREFEVLKERYLEEYQKKYPNGPPSYPHTPGRGTVNPGALQLNGPASPSSVERQVNRAAGRGDLFQYINDIATLKGDEDAWMGRAEKTTPDFPNTKGTSRHPTAAISQPASVPRPTWARQPTVAPHPAPELGIPAEPITDDDILLVLLKLQLPQLAHVDFVRKYRALLNRRTREGDDRVKKSRKLGENTIGLIEQTAGTKFSDPILRIAGGENTCEQPQSGERRPMQQPARRSSAIFNAMPGPPRSSE